MGTDGSLNLLSPFLKQKEQLSLQEVLAKAKVANLIFSILFSAWHATNINSFSFTPSNQIHSPLI